MRVRNNPDVSSLANAVARPGIDTRVWSTLAVVLDVHVDEDNGVYADVQYMPDQTIETALVATGYSGDGFGAYAPLKVDDLVLVTIPMGDSAQGPIITRRLWSGSEKPPPEIHNGGEPTQNPTVVVEGGVTLTVICRDGASVNIVAENGNVKLNSPDVRLGGDDPQEAALLGDEFLKNLLSGAIVGTGTGPSTVLIPAPGDATPWESSLSQKVKIEP